MQTDPASGWRQSLYWRIGISFVVFVLGVVVIQSAIISYTLERSTADFPGRAPNNLASTIAAGASAALARDPDADLSAYLRETRRGDLHVFVVMKDGLIADNGLGTLPEDMRRAALDMLNGTGPAEGRAAPVLPIPVVVAPVVVGGELRGLVVLPPQAPQLFRDVPRFLSLPGTVVLLAATVLAALFIFGPARRRLLALETAAARLGAGDLDARAPSRGGDEVARLARTFNRMADELAARDAALRTSNRLRGQMVADVSHELKTPLTAVRGYLETLRMPDVEGDPVARRRCLDTAERETARLERIVNDLVDLARYENGVGAIEPRAFDIGRLFGHVIDRHERESTRRGISLRSSIAPDADQLSADPGRLEQVIENLVTNALRHTPDGGEVVLSASRESDTAILSVADTGEGIPAAHLPYVFDRFYKAEPSRTGGAAGSGLGLSIVKAIVERHGGSIDVVSAPGGTRFTIRLPQAPSANL